MLTRASRVDVMNRLGRALADPTRARILLRLLDEPGYPARLAEELQLTRTNVSKHLACLRGCGIVVAVPQGRSTRYEIADPHLSRALDAWSTSFSPSMTALTARTRTATSPCAAEPAHERRRTARCPLSAARRSVLQRRVRWIVAATITYNVIEAVIAIAAGTVASSTALIGFGLDSIVEVLSAAAVAWQFAGRDPEARERTTLKVIAVSFFGLALYVTVDAALTFAGLREPEHSTVGIVLAAVEPRRDAVPQPAGAARREGTRLRVRYR